MGGMPPRNFEFAFSSRERERVAGKGNRGQRLSSRVPPLNVQRGVHSEATSGALSSR